jgi:hypothetical protein
MFFEPIDKNDWYILLPIHRKSNGVWVIIPKKIMT